MPLAPAAPEADAETAASMADLEQSKAGKVGRGCPPKGVPLTFVQRPVVALSAATVLCDLSPAQMQTASSSLQLCLQAVKQDALAALDREAASMLTVVGETDLAGLAEVTGDCLSRRTPTVRPNFRAWTFTEAHGLLCPQREAFAAVHHSYAAAYSVHGRRPIHCRGFCRRRGAAPPHALHAACDINGILSSCRC